MGLPSFLWTGALCASDRDSGGLICGRDALLEMLSHKQNEMSRLFTFKQDNLEIHKLFIEIL